MIYAKGLFLQGTWIDLELQSVYMQQQCLFGKANWWNFRKNYIIDSLNAKSVLTYTYGLLTGKSQSKQI